MTDTPTAAAVVVTAPAPARTTWKDLLPLVAILMTIAGIIYAAGQLHSRISATESAVSKLETRADRVDGDTRDLGRKLERVDGKLDLLIERTPARP
jgi:hypothetical protein